MGGHDDYVSNFDDWGAPSPSPSPKTFFSSLLVDDINSRSIPENNNMSFPSGRDDNKNEPSGGLAGGEITRLNMYSQQKTNSHGGLMERMAARAGFNAPKLNTENVRPAGLSQNQDVRSSFLTIPPGLSPTTLLESPVFLTNAMAQPSPTTGKFSFASGNYSSTQEGHDQSRYNFYEDMNTSSFAFNPVPDSGPSNNNFPGFEVSKGVAVSAENSSTPDEQQDEEGDLPLPGGAPADDGYNWRKYGQKQVKGSEFPRGYYKCTHLNCPAKKKVERSKEGHITEIIYNGAHSHPKPSPSRRSSFADVADGAVEVTSSASFGAESLVEGPPACLNGDDEEEDDRATRGSVSLDCDGEENESESKRRKVEAYTAADMTGATRAIREPRVVVQTTSEVDILDDGYRWRKYGQKVVKGNPNPRSYYKCTHTGCTVRKHVERASHDLKSVITTYEGKHNHEVPAARNSSHHNSSSTIISNGPSILAHLQRPDQSHTNMPMFDRSSAMGSYGRQQQFGPGFSFGMSQQGLANMAMDQHQQSYNGMVGMLPKGEPKVEPFGEAASTNLQNGSFSAYHQIMNKFPL